MANHYIINIAKSRLPIYDPIEVGDPDLWIPTPDLERIFNEKLVGIDGLNVPIRTRSKLVKQHVCRALGYPVPKSFTKIQPRFFGQMFDTYAQKANNLQVWNEELSPSRRYVILRVDDTGVIRVSKSSTGKSWRNSTPRGP
ncbi:MAG: hypothetical protein PSN37_03960 [Alphaproteobacteria bacterium]|nr:hypothetical protein [Alphaproteobacteria bacterium]